MAKLSGTGYQVKSYLIRALQAKGFKGDAQVAAAGIIGNLAVESGNFDPRVITTERRGDGGVAKGLAQWHPDRWSNLESWSKSTGQNPKTWQAQAGFIVHEMTELGEREAWRRLERARNPVEATQAFLAYERPAGYKSNDSTGSSHYQDRVGHAVNYSRGFANSQSATSQEKSTPPAPRPAMDPNGMLPQLGAGASTQPPNYDVPDTQYQEGYSEREQELLASVQQFKPPPMIKIDNLLAKHRMM